MLGLSYVLKLLNIIYLTYLAYLAYILDYFYPARKRSGRRTFLPARVV
jgi:hypothetical protein